MSSLFIFCPFMKQFAFPLMLLHVANSQLIFFTWKRHSMCIINQFCGRDRLIKCLLLFSKSLLTPLFLIKANSKCYVLWSFRYLSNSKDFGFFSMSVRFINFVICGIPKKQKILRACPFKQSVLYIDKFARNSIDHVATL